MDAIGQAIDSVMLKISELLYQPWFMPMLLLFGGLYFTVRCKGMQIRMFGEACRVIKDRPKSAHGISSFGALMMSTASRVGTGNIIGVATAIVLGGAGAVFWMWVMAILGGATAFVESTLAQIYKKKNKDGTSYGGPAFYMEKALKQRWLGMIFSVLIILTYAVGYNMLASYNLQTTFEKFSFYSESTPMIVGIILAVLFAIIIIGGAKRLSKVTGIMVPIMGIAYIVIAIVVVFINIKNIPAMFGAIFDSAFDFGAIFGGFAGSCLMFGIKRGLFSNEAGMGSAPNAAATADVSHPVKQGLVQMLSVFIDTLLICTATAFMCLSSGVDTSGFLAGDGTADAAAYVQASMEESLGAFGPIFIAVSMSLFAFTTLIGNYGYCEGCLKFLFKKEPSKVGLLIFRLAATALVFVGAVASASLVWDTADVLQGLMVLCNVPTILILGGRAFKCLDDYVRQRKLGKDPHYIAAENGVKEETDFWK